MSGHQKVVVLGASGGIGSHVVEELAGRGHHVIAVNRSGTLAAPVGVERRAGDVEDAAAARAVTAGADVVVLAAQPPYGAWHGRFERMVDNTLAAAEAHGARLVMVDNLYAYGAPDRPITEDTPERPVTASNVLRRDLGRRLLDAHASGRVPVTIGRCSDYYGPRGTNTVLAALGITPGVAGKPMRGLVSLDVPHTYHYLPDAARGFRVLVEDERADGHAWILPAAPALTQRQMLELINRHLPRSVPVKRLGPGMLRVGALFSAQIRGTWQVAHQFGQPWLVDASRFERTFGAVPTTSHDEAIAETVAWFLQPGRA